MELLSRTYGWTPSQIRDEYAQDIWQYVEIVLERDKIERAQRLKAKL